MVDEKMPSLSLDRTYFVNSEDNRPLKAQEFLEKISGHDGEYQGIKIWENYWDCTFSYRVDEGDNRKLRLMLSLSCRTKNFQMDFPRELKVDYLIHKGNFLPLRPSAAKALSDLPALVFQDGDSALSVIELLSLEYFAAEQSIPLENLDLRSRFLAGHVSDEGLGSSGLSLEPYPYQSVGIEWLDAQQRIGKPGALLCDVMGLGKTLQGIGLIVKNLQRGLGQNLVVCPSTLIENWKREFAKFAPQVEPYVHSGPFRSGVVKALLEKEVVITSYDTLVIDFSILQNVDWNVVVIDEAQAIKNPNAKRTHRAKELKRKFSVAVTGTPLENRLLDLWSLVNFANPGILGEKSDFEFNFPEEPESAAAISELIKPIMLRRKLDQVENQLPDITVIDHPLTWPSELIDVYENVRRIAWEQFPVSGGLVATTRLRMLATHPRLLGIGSSNLMDHSPKLALSVELLDELFANGEKALVFTSYLEMIDAFVFELSERFPRAFVRNLDRRVPIQDRQDLVDAFNAFDGPGVLVCNPIVAGAGLNITGANHVIHYNLEWNPAKEDQATFRVYRNGQTKHSFIHRLFYLDTIDQVIDTRIARKRLLSDLSVDSIEDQDDFKFAMQISPRRID